MSRNPNKRSAGLCLALLGALPFVAGLPASDVSAAASAHPYSLTKSITLGAPDRWDYLTYDPTSGRLYAAHSTSIDVIDIAAGKVIGRVPVGGANGVAIVPARGKGYAGSRDRKAVLVFDLKTLKVTSEIPAAEDTDGTVYDPFSHRVFVVEGDPAAATVVDTDRDALVRQLPLGGKPEFAVVDGAGHLFVNIADKHEIARVQTKALTIDARWPMPACVSPHGLAIDVRRGRLFSTCANAKMVVLDTSDGHILSTLDIGNGSDAAAFDATNNLAFSSNGEGSITVVRQSGDKDYVVQDTVPTEPLARTMAVDPASGRLFLLSADRTEVDPNATSARARYGVRPGSVRLLILDRSGNATP